MAERLMRWRRAAALGAAVAGGVTTVGYLRLISEQGTPMSGRIAFFATFIALMSVLALVGAVIQPRDDRIAQVAFVGAAAGFLGAGFVALFSIGTPILLAGVLALIAARPLRAPGLATAGAIAGALALLAGGLFLTS